MSPEDAHFLRSWWARTCAPRASISICAAIVPYGIYDRFEFDVPLGRCLRGLQGQAVGDCYDRFVVRLLESPRIDPDLSARSLDQMPPTSGKEDDPVGGWWRGQGRGRKPCASLRWARSTSAPRIRAARPATTSCPMAPRMPYRVQASAPVPSPPLSIFEKLTPGLMIADHGRPDRLLRHRPSGGRPMTFSVRPCFRRIGRCLVRRIQAFPRIRSPNSGSPC